MNYKKLFSMTLLCCSLWTLCSGCAHMVPISVQPTALAAGDKLPLTAALVMNKDLLDYKYEFHMMGDTWVYRFGEPCKITRGGWLARHFSEWRRRPLRKAPSPFHPPILFCSAAREGG